MCEFNHFGFDVAAVELLAYIVFVCATLWYVKALRVFWLDEIGRHNHECDRLGHVKDNTQEKKEKKNSKNSSHYIQNGISILADPKEKKKTKKQIVLAVRLLL